MAKKYFHEDILYVTLINDLAEIYFARRSYSQALLLFTSCYKVLERIMDKYGF